MKYKDVAEAYDKLFKGDDSLEDWNRGGPMPLVKKLENFIASGDVLDIGAGAGQNCVYRLQRSGDGYLSRRYRDNPGKSASKNVSLHTDIHDIVDEELENDFDVIICAAVLHHLYTEDAFSVIQKIQQHTKPMGFNIISTFTKRGDFYSKNPSTNKFYIDSNEDLNNLYSNWTVHISFEKKGPACQKGPNGETLFNVFASMLSQKINKPQ